MACSPNTPKDDRAESLFSITFVDAEDKTRQRTKNGKENAMGKIEWLKSPFAQRGKFKTYNTMDLFYEINPSKRWTGMNRYRSFVINGLKYAMGNFIYVANDTSIEQRQNVNAQETTQTGKKSNTDWIAYILEIRASDEYHVYALVCWMYWPDELPRGTQDGTRRIQGRQPYHGMNELVASNHHIVDVLSITSTAEVEQWDEQGDEPLQCALYWRQAYDYRTRELSSVRAMCSCGTPENPDKKLLRCDECMTWMHEECLVHNALGMAYSRMDAKEIYLPRECGVAVSGKQSGHQAASGNDDSGASNNNHQVIVSSGRDSDWLGKKVSGNNRGNLKPWEGLFEASLNTEQSGPPLIQVTDLRSVKTWTESVKCLCCGVAIS